jgi:hypothetical protein
MSVLPTGCVVYFDDYDFNFGSRLTGEARLVAEVNRGLFGQGIEVVLDRRLSWHTDRVYRVTRLAADVAYMPVSRAPSRTWVDRDPPPKERLGASVRLRNPSVLGSARAVAGQPTVTAP